MKERPIIFSSESVRAILAGNKTQTRRVMKLQPKIFLAQDHSGPFLWFDYLKKGYPQGRFFEKDLNNLISDLSPYGYAGDRLWVREAWALDFDYSASYMFKADGWYEEIKWRSPIYMPHWVSRIALEIVSVRVERVQVITRADAKAEGMSNGWLWSEERNEKHPEHFARSVLNPYIANYSVLWDSLNSKRGFGWDVNPWVWVIEFKRMAG